MNRCLYVLYIFLIVCVCQCIRAFLILISMCVYDCCDNVLHQPRTVLLEKYKVNKNYMVTSVVSPSVCKDVMKQLLSASLLFLYF